MPKIDRTYASLNIGVDSVGTAGNTPRYIIHAAQPEQKYHFYMYAPLLFCLLLLQILSGIKCSWFSIIH